MTDVYVQARLRVCNTCEHKRQVFFAPNTCKVCGCVIHAKVRIKSANCPLSKWYGDPPMDFETWSDHNEQDITCIAAETGADREMDYDREVLEERLYEDYLNHRSQLKKALDR